MTDDRSDTAKSSPGPHYVEVPGKPGEYYFDYDAAEAAGEKTATALIADGFLDEMKLGQCQSPEESDSPESET